MTGDAGDEDPLHPVEAILPQLIDRLERAADLVTRSDALDHLRIVADLCSEARHLAMSAALLREALASG